MVWQVGQSFHLSLADGQNPSNEAIGSNGEMRWTLSDELNWTLAEARRHAVIEGLKKIYEEKDEKVRIHYGPIQELQLPETDENEVYIHLETLDADIASKYTQDSYNYFKDPAEFKNWKKGKFWFA